MTAKLLDSAARIPWAQARGYAGGIRYVSGEPAKNLTLAEKQEAHAAGKHLTLVYEDGGLDFFGVKAGNDKAAIAKSVLADLEWDPALPVYCAFDVVNGRTVTPSRYASAWAAINAFASALGRPPAVYGPRPFLYWLEQTHGVSYLWEFGSAAFNTGPEPTHLCLRQLAEQVDVGGVTCDVDEALASYWGQSLPPAPKPSPVPQPKPTPPPTQGVCDVQMPVLHPGDKRRDAVQVLQGALKARGAYPRFARCNGNFGKMTRRAVVKFQRRHGIMADGICGKQTWEALAGEKV